MKELSELVSTSQPLFTLTAEEVEIVEESLNYSKTVLINTHCINPEVEPILQEARIKVDNLLIKINQWKDENKIDKRTEPTSD